MHSDADSSFVPSCRKPKPGLLIITILNDGGFAFCKAVFNNIL